MAKSNTQARFVPVSALEIVASRRTLDATDAAAAGAAGALVKTAERRLDPRFTVDPMYSAVRVVRGKHACDGHIYEIGLGGMRFELDRAMPKGSLIEVAIELPGCQELIRASGTIVRVFDKADDPGPRRMVVEFESFAQGARAILKRYLDQKWLRVAPTQEFDARPRKRAVTVETVSARGSSRTTTRSASAA